MNKAAAMQIYRVAQMYYLEDLSQQEISQQEHISRSQISRMLKKARELNIVQIRLAYPESYRRSFLADELKSALGLREIYLTSPVCGMEDADVHFAEEAAPILQEVLKSSEITGIGWGRTIWRISQNLKECRDQKDHSFVSMVGLAATDNPCLQTNSIVERFSEKYHASAHFNNFKPFIQSGQMSRVDIDRWQSLLRCWEEMDTAVVGIGDRLQTSAQYSAEFEFGRKSMQDIEKMTGDILGNFFGSEGAVYRFPDGTHPSSPKLESLRSVGHVICTAFGVQKVPSLILAAHLRYYNTLITDEETALALESALSPDTEQTQ